MVFPLLPILVYGGGALIAGGIAWGAKEFGEEAGKGAGQSINSILIIAAIGLIAFFILKKRGKI